MRWCKKMDTAIRKGEERLFIGPQAGPSYKGLNRNNDSQVAQVVFTMDCFQPSSQNCKDKKKNCKDS